MDEATKTKRLWDESTLSLLQGEGIDIGCGRDPIFDWVDRFDLEQGDANEIQDHVDRTYDFVFSCHVLEHMHDPRQVIRKWYRLLKPGGRLIVIVPDEDLYEQGRFPSLFNADHRWTFTISKHTSWSPRSINVLDLVNSLGGELLSLELQDQGIDRALLHHAPGPWARLLFRVFEKLVRRVRSPSWQRRWARLFRLIGGVIDQTALGDSRVAQIQFIVRRPRVQP